MSEVLKHNSIGIQPQGGGMQGNSLPNLGICMVGPLAYILGPLSKMIEAFIRARQDILKTQEQTFALAGRTAEAAQTATLAGADLQRSQLFADAAVGFSNTAIGLGVMGISASHGGRYGKDICKLDKKIDNVSEFQTKIAKSPENVRVRLEMEGTASGAQRAQESCCGQTRLLKEKSSKAFDKPIGERTIAELQAEGPPAEHLQFSKDRLHQMENEKSALQTKRTTIEQRYYMGNQLFNSSLSNGLQSSVKARFLHDIAVQESTKEMNRSFVGMAQEIQRSSGGQGDGFQQGITQAIQIMERALSSTRV